MYYSETHYKLGKQSEFKSTYSKCTFHSSSVQNLWSLAFRSIRLILLGLLQALLATLVFGFLFISVDGPCVLDKIVYVYQIQPIVFKSSVVSSFWLLALSMTEFLLWHWSCSFLLYFYQSLLYIFSSYFMKYTQDWSKSCFLVTLGL